MAQLKSTTVNGNLAVTNNITASSFVKLGGTGSQFLMADGSVKTLSEAGGAYTLPEATSSVLGGVKIGSNISVSNGVISLTQTNVTTALGYTPPTVNTTYATATTTAAGLMSSSDKAKLNNIEAGANNYTYTLPTATASALGGIKIGYSESGANVPLKLSSEKGYVTLTSNAVISALGYTPPTVNTTYATATTTAAGLMSAADKTRLNNTVLLSGDEQTISSKLTFSSSLKVSGRYNNSGDDEGIIVTPASNGYAGVCLGDPVGKRSVFYLTSAGNPVWRFNKYTDTDKTSYDIQHPGKAGTIALTTDIPAAYSLPQATSSTLGGVKIGSNISVTSGVISLTQGNVTNALGYTPPTVNTTYNAASQSAAGLMSAADKTKLDGIATGANNFTYTLPTAAQTTLGGVKVWLTNGTTLNISTN